MNLSRSRLSVLQALVVLGIGILAGGLLSSAPQAQTSGADTASAAAAELAALEARVTALEEDKNKPQTLTAPFTVADPAGKPIFSVSSSGATASVRIVGAGGSLALVASDDLEISAAGSSGSAVLNVAGGQSTLKLGSSAGSVFLGDNGGGPAIRVTQGSDQIFGVGTAGDGTALTVGKAGKAVSLSTQSGKTGVDVLDAGHEYQIGDIDNIRGFAAYSGGQPLGGLGALGSDQFRVAIYNGTKPAFIGGYDPSGKLGMFLSDSSGKPVASIVGEDGSSTLTLGQTSGNIMLKTDSGKATLTAKVDQRQTEMGVTQASTGFVIGDEAKPLAALVDNGDSKPFLGIYSGGSSPVVAAGYQPSGKVGLRIGEAASPVALLGPSDGGSGSLNLYGASGGTPLISLTNPGGSNPQIQIMGAGGQAVFLAGAKSDGSGGALKVLANGQQLAGIDSLPSGTGDIYVLAAQKVVAEMRADSGKGVVAIYGDSGAAVAHMGVGGGGGGNFTAADPGGNGVFSAGYIASDGPGTACVEHNGTKCLGVGLTGMEGFH
jgi:hypothetical protein